MPGSATQDARSVVITRQAGRIALGEHSGRLYYHLEGGSLGLVPPALLEVRHSQ